MSPSKKLPTEGGRPLGQNPFAALGGAVAGTRIDPASLPAAAKPVCPSTREPAAAASPAKNRGRVDILRSTAGRGGKTVTVVQGFVGLGLPEKEFLSKKMQRRCGCGGTVKEGRIEIQGDQRDVVAEVLVEAGFRPVFAGG